MKKQKRTAPRHPNVGYAKPPKHSRFKPGVSGNPKGRPKGSRSFLTTLRLILREKVKVTEAGREREMSKSEALARTLVKQAFSGNMKAFHFLSAIHDRLDEVDDTTSRAVNPKEDQQIIDSYIARLARKNGGKK